MQPSESYFKSKRNVVLFASALLLIIFSGVEVKPGDYSIQGVTITFKDTSFFDLIISVVVLYYLIQISLFWSAQNEEIKSLLQFRADFYISFLIGCVAISSYITVKILIPNIGDIMDSTKVILGLISGFLMSVVTYTILPIIQKALEKSRLAKEEKGASIFEMLPRKKWKLIFNPRHPDLGHKTITFNLDGTIVEGKNNNETSWEARGEFLEILNSEGRVFSRFKYDKQKQKFIHTNDEDTLSLRYQRIEPIGERDPGG